MNTSAENMPETETHSKSENTVKNGKGEPKTTVHPKKPADYLSYKASETTEDHIVKGQQEARQKSTNQRPEATKRHSFSRHASSDANEPNIVRKGLGSTEVDGVQDRPLSRTQSGKNPANGRKQNNRKPAHSRSQSHTKVNTRLSTSAGGNKPYLSRSKSTDGIIPKRPSVKRNNRSQTKLSNLYPLTKTMSNGSLNRALGALQPLTKTMSKDSLKSYGLRKTVSNGSGKSSQMGLTKTDSNQSMKSNKSSNSLKSLTFATGRSNTTHNHNKSNTSLKGLTGLSGLAGTGTTGLKSSSKRERAILRLNEEDTYNEYEDMSEESDEVEETERNGEEARSENESVSAPAENQSKNQSYVDEEREPEPEPETKSKARPPFTSPETRTDSAQSTQSYSGNAGSDEEQPLNTNLYGGSFLLSQSTGMTRKIEPANELLRFNSTETRGKNNNNDDDADLANSMNMKRSAATDTNSGIVFRPRGETETRVAEIEPAVTKTNATQGSYQPNQTIFSNLQRNDSKYLSNIKHQKQQGSGTSSASTDLVSETGAGNGTGTGMKKDFSSYLNNQPGSSGNNNNIETRTQQRLWLQRENSLLDVSANLDMSRVGNFSNLSLNKLMFAHNYNNNNNNNNTNSFNTNGSAANVRDTPGSMVSWIQNQNQNLEGGAGSADASPSTPKDAATLNAANMLYLIQNGQQNSIQSRTEFERLNREYLNVRRHLNPVAESLNRVQKAGHGKTQLEVQKKNDKKSAYTASASTNANSFKEFSPSWEKQEGESILVLNKIWQDALLQSSSATLSSRLLQQEQQRQYHSSQQQRLGEYANQSSSQDFIGTNQMKQQRRNLGNGITRSVGPSTRASKMALAAHEQDTRQRF